MARSMARAWAAELLSMTNDVHDEIAEILKDVNELQERVDGIQERVIRMGAGRDNDISWVREEIPEEDGTPPAKSEAAKRRADAAALEKLAHRMRSGRCTDAEVESVLKAVMPD